MGLLKFLFGYTGTFDLLSRCEQKLIDLQSKVERLEFNVETMQNHLGALPTSIVQELQNINKSSLSILDSKLTTIASEISEVRQKQAQLSGEFATTFQSQLTPVASSLAEVIAEVSGQWRETMSLSHRETMDCLDRHSLDIAKIMEALQQESQRIDHCISNLQQRLDLALQQNSGCEERISKLDQDLENIHAIFSESQQQYSQNVNKMISGLEQTSYKIDSLQQMQTSLSQMQNQIGKFVEEQPKHVGQILEIAQKVERLLFEVNSQIEQKVVAETNRIGKAVFKLNTTTESVRDNFQKGMETFEREKTQRQQQNFKEGIQKRELDIARDVFALMDALDAGVDTGEQLLNAPARARFGLFSKTQGVIPKDAVQSWLVGIKLMRDRVIRILASMDVEPISSVGITFDPHFHNAIGVENGPNNIVLQEITKGYKLKSRDQILRYAEVIVGKNSALT